MRLGLLVTLAAVLQVVALADMHMVTIDGHTMVKLRGFCHEFGASYDRDAATHTYSVSRNGRTVYIVPYSTVAWIDDRQVEMKHPSVIVDHALYVPVRFMCNAFDLGCTWGADFRQVVVIDVVTHTQVTWIRDDAWAGRAHVWPHPASYRFTLKVTAPPRQSFHGRPTGPMIPVGHKPAAGVHIQQTGTHNMPGFHGQPPTGAHNMPPGHGQPPTSIHNMPSGVHGQPSTGVHGNMPSGIHTMPNGVHGQPSPDVHTMPAGHHGQPPTSVQPSAGGHGRPTSEAPRHEDNGNTKNDNKDNRHSDH